MPVIRTVCGDIRPEELGCTSVHEHTIMSAKVMGDILEKSMPLMMEGIKSYRGGADLGEEMARRMKEQLPPVPQRDIQGVIKSLRLPEDHPGNKLSGIDYYTKELETFRQVGGQSLCDCSTRPNDTPFSQVRELSQKSGVHILVCAGFYTKPSMPQDVLDGNEIYIRGLVENQIANGDGSCDARPGFVKCAVSLVERGKISAAELNNVRACAKTAKAHGMSLHIHTGFPVRKEHISQLAEELKSKIGIDPDKVIFCHMDDHSIGFNPSAHINEDGYDIELPLSLIKSGFNVGLDTWSISMAEKEVANYAIRARKGLLKELIVKGGADHIVLGHDMNSRASGVQNNGCGYTMWPTVLKEMVDQGELDPDDYQRMTVLNPSRILTIG